MSKNLCWKRINENDFNIDLEIKIIIIFILKIMDLKCNRKHEMQRIEKIWFYRRMEKGLIIF